MPTMPAWKSNAPPSLANSWHGGLCISAKVVLVDQILVSAMSTADANEPCSGFSCMVSLGYYGHQNVHTHTFIG